MSVMERLCISIGIDKLNIIENLERVPDACRNLAYVLKGGISHH